MGEMEGGIGVDLKEMELLEKDVFEWSPLSYRVHRKSALKLAVADKLHHFIGIFSDQTLVEYIIVLICNGKTQYQARDELEEFIGENTGRFIAWLWNYLSKQKDNTEAKEESNDYLKNKIEIESPIHINDNHSGETFLGKNGSIEEKNYSVGGEESEYSEYPSRRFRISSEISTGGIQYSPYYKKSQHGKREENMHHIESPSRDSRSSWRPRSEIVSRGFNSHSIDREKTWVTEPKKKSPDKKLVMDKEIKNTKSIWDRLGKPNNQIPNQMKIFGERNLNPFSRERDHIPIHNPNPPFMVYNHSVPVSNYHSCAHMFHPVPVRAPVPKPVFQIGTHLDHLEIASLRKRQFEEIEKDLHERGVFVNSDEKRVPVNQRLKFCHADNNNESGHNEIIQLEEGEFEQTENQLDVQSENNKEAPQKEMLEMKMKLEEMEKNMKELRSNLKLDSKMNPASVNRLEDPVELRTVYVTNVHFGAKKEALMSHFMKCGSVVKVVILTNPFTAQPKGAAYVEFTSKESAQNALSLNGSSFFSRVLTVVLKKDMPAQQVRGQSYANWSKPPSGTPLQFKRSNNRLQWTRETAPSTSPTNNT